MKDWSAVFIVTARGGSKRLPGKNLAQIAGRPLLAYTADAVAESGLPYPVLLTTDSEEIMAVGRSLQWEVPFSRPAELTTSSVAAVDAVMHAIDWAKASHSEPELVMLLQPTSPLRGGAAIRQAFDLLAARSEANSVLSVSGGPDGEALLPNGAIYLVRTAALRQTGDLSAAPNLLLTMAPEQSVDIDTEEDFHRAEMLLLRRGKTPGAA